MQSSQGFDNFLRSLEKLGLWCQNAKVSKRNKIEEVVSDVQFTVFLYTTFAFTSLKLSL